MSKTEIPKVTKTLDGQPVEQIERFVNFGQLINENGNCDV